MKQVLTEILSVAAVLSFFVPLLLTIVKKLWRDPFFMSFAIYWAFSGVIGLTDFIPGVPMQVSQTIGVVANMIDIPIVLALLYFTSTSLPIKRFAGAAFICHVLLETTGIVIKGVSYDALKYTLGAGLIFALIVIAWEILKYVRSVETSNRQNAKVLIYAAIFFEYTCYIVVYVVDYFAPDDFYKARRDDMYVIYYVSTLIGIFIASFGYLLYRKHTKKEVLINEVKIDII